MKALLVVTVFLCCISALLAEETLAPTAPTPAPTPPATPPTPAATTVATTTSIPTDPVEYCKHKTAGRFLWPSDLTCKTYVYCFVSGSTLSGAIYTCAGTTTYNPTLQMCDTTKAACV